MIPHVNFASKLFTNKFFPLIQPGGTFSPTQEVPGGAGVIAMPWLRRLGVAVTALGRFTDSDERTYDFLQNEGIKVRMQKVDGVVAKNTVVHMDEPAVLNFVPVRAEWEPTSTEGAYLSRCQADAMVLSGSLTNEYAAFLIDTAAARGQRVFWNASGAANLKLARVGQVILQVSHTEFGDGRLSPGDLARQLRRHSGAKACVVTAAERGSWTAASSNGPLLHTPALRLCPDDVNRSIGAGDAHLAGLVAGYLLAIGQHRVERALKLARLVAAYYISGAPGGSWHQLGLFERRFSEEKTDIRSVA